MTLSHESTSERARLTLRRLVAPQLETAIRRARILQGDEWTDHVRTQGLLVDLTGVEWVEIGAALQLVLFVDAAARAQISVLIGLPLDRERRAETQWLRTPKGQSLAYTVARRVERRIAARNFLNHLQFELAVRNDDLTRRRVIVVGDLDLSDEPPTDVDQGTAAEVGVPDASPSTLPQQYEYCFPLTWFASTAASDASMARFLSFVAGNARRGIDVPDAEALAQVVLYELVENAKVHSTSEPTGRALVCALACPPQALPDDAECFEAERSYFEWLRGSGRPAVQVVVGDSGLGVPRTIEEAYRDAPTRGFAIPKLAQSEAANRMFWAFDRWSTRGDLSTTRGTRGLYRLHRIVRKYAGLITMRSADELVGWDHGGGAHAEALHESTRLPQSPGTVVRMWLPSIRADVEIPSLTRSEDPATKFHFINLGLITTDGIADERWAELVASRPAQSAADVGCILASVAGGTPHGVLPALTRAVEIRHPDALVLAGLPGSWDGIENAIDALNRTLEASGRTSAAANTEVWDPVLVLGDRGQAAWVGATETHRRILDALLARGGPLTREDVAALLPDASARNAVLRAIIEDPSVARIDKDGSVHLRWSLGDIVAEVRAAVGREVDRATTGVTAGQEVITPSLQCVRGWIDVDRVVADACGLPFATLALVVSLQGSTVTATAASEHPILATEAVAHSTVLKLLARGLAAGQIARVTVDAGAPVGRGKRIFHDGASVVVYTPMPRAGEAARRVLKEVIREGGTPVAVVCLVDARGTGDSPVEVWGHTVPVVSLCVRDLHVRTPVAADVPRVSPVTNTVEPLATMQPLRPTRLHLRPVIEPGGMASLLESQRALYVGHIERPNGRHFTFYVHPLRLVNAPAVVTALTTALDRWAVRADPDALSRVAIWYPRAPSDLPNSASEGLARRVADRHGWPTVAIKRFPLYGHWLFVPPAESAHDTIIVIDWGVITGTTLTQMILLAARAGAKQVFALSCLGQLPEDEEDFLHALEKLSVLRRTAPPTAAPLFLPGFVDESAVPAEESAARVDLMFLSRLNVGAYEQDCPVCQTLASLACGPFPTRVLEEYVAELEASLVARAWEDLADYDPAYPDGSAMPPNRTTHMLRWRERLLTALASVPEREAIARDLDAALGSNERQSDESLALLDLLSIESQWLRYAPLNLAALRRALARLSREIAITSSVAIHDRVVAVRVLRYASKWHFAHAFPAIFQAAQGLDAVVLEALLGAFTYLRRPYLTTEELLDPMAGALRDVIAQRDAKRLHVSPEIYTTLIRLDYRANARRYVAQVRDYTAAQAWRALREHYAGYEHHDERYRSASRLRSRPHVDALDALVEKARGGETTRWSGGEPIYAWLQQFDENWSRCCQFLDFTILPLLERIAPTLQTVDADTTLGVDTWRILMPFIEGQLLADSMLTRHVREIARDPHTVFESGIWVRVRDRIQWWFERFFALGGTWTGQSRLQRFLSFAPQPIGVIPATVERFLAQAQSETTLERSGDTENDTLIFCTSHVIQDLCAEIVENAIHRRDAQSTGPMTFALDIRRHSHGVRVTVLNDRSLQPGPAAPPGSGLDKMATRLNAFGVTLRKISRPDDSRWTFGVAVDFVLME